MNNNAELIKPYEDAERELTQQVYNTFNIKYYNFTPPEERKPYDSSYKINQQDSSIMVEVKVRSFPIDRYDDFILEIPKLNSLIKLYNKGLMPEYWMFFLSDDGAYSLLIFKLWWRIKEWAEKGIPIERKLMNAQTFRGDTKTMKEVVMLRYEKGKDVKFTGKKWRIN